MDREAPRIMPDVIIEHKRSGKLYYILSIEHWNNLLTGEKAHAKCLSNENKVIQLGVDFIRSEFWHFA